MTPLTFDAIVYKNPLPNPIAIGESVNTSPILWSLPWAVRTKEVTAPPDTVNNKLLTAGGDYSQEATKNLAPKKAKLKPTKQSEKIVS